MIYKIITLTPLGMVKAFHYDIKQVDMNNT